MFSNRWTKIGVHRTNFYFAIRDQSKIIFYSRVSKVNQTYKFNDNEMIVDQQVIESATDGSLFISETPKIMGHF